MSQENPLRIPEDGEAGFRLIFSQNPLPMWVYDEETLRLLEVNQAAVARYGYSREEFLQLNLTDLHAPEEAARLMRLLQSDSRNVAIGGYWQHRRKDRSLLEAEIATHRLEFGGRLARLVLVQDVTDRKQAERQALERAARLDALLEGSPIAIVVLDTAHRVQICNSAFEYLFQYRREEMIGVPLDNLVAPREFWQEAQELTRRASAGEAVRARTRRRRKDGSLVHVEVRGVPLEVEGELVGAFAFYEDISQRLRAEEQQNSSAERYRLLFERNLAGVCRATVDGEVLECNDSFARMLGYDSPEELRSRRAADMYFSPEDRQQHLRLLRAHGCLTNFELRLRRKDGNAVWVLENVSLLPGENGSPAIVEGTVIDITGRKEVEEALQQAEQLYRSIVENAVEGIFQTTPDGGYVSINPALARMYGYDSPAELMASVTDIGRQVYVDPARRAEFKRQMEEHGVVEGFEYQVFRRDGVKLWLSENARAIRDARGHVLLYEGTVEDITERKRVEAEREVMYEVIHGVNVTANLDELLRLIHRALKKILYAENCFVALYDHATEAFNFPFFVDQFDSAPPPQKVGRSCTAYVFRTGQPQLITQADFEELVRRGEVELVGTPSPTWLGVPLKTSHATIGVLVVQHYQDERAYTKRELDFLASVGAQIAMAIDRKRSEDALRENETRLRLLIEQLPAVLWTTDRELRFTSSLGAGLAGMGLKPNEVAGMSLSEFFKTDDPEFVAIQAHGRALAGEAVTFDVQWAGRLYESHVEPLRGGDGRPVGTIGMALDVSERKQLEDQLRQAQKMEAVGRLAGGIAHDFNNLLMVIRGYSELLLDGSRLGDPVHRSAEQIQKAADRAASLTRQLLAFSRKQVLAPTVLDINAVVSDMGKMLPRLIGEDIELAIAMRPGLAKVRADRGQIEQVILNLAVNARDALPQGGKLTIETANVELDEEYSRRHAGVRPGRYVMLAVTDTGMGMDAETQAHIFEPFFTTKGRGTGLGLATVYGVVKQSGGYIWVYSEVGKGTTFKVYLPLMEASLDSAAPLRGAAEPEPGDETILVVEDEDGVRELAREFLERSGYTVLLARSGNEAVTVASRHPGPIHLLMTDVVMPGMSGRELAEQMAQVRPEMKVLYMSGYTDDAIVHHGILDRGTVLLQKPFTRSNLSQKIREVLELKPQPS